MLFSTVALRSAPTVHPPDQEQRTNLKKNVTGKRRPTYLILTFRTPMPQVIPTKVGL